MEERLHILCMNCYKMKNNCIIYGETHVAGVERCVNYTELHEFSIRLCNLVLNLMSILGHSHYNKLLVCY